MYEENVKQLVAAILLQAVEDYMSGKYDRKNILRELRSKHMERLSGDMGKITADDLVADYLEDTEAIGLYYDHLELETIAKCTEYKTAEAYTEAHNLTCCGNHGIYIELLNIEEVSE